MRGPIPVSKSALCVSKMFDSVEIDSTTGCTRERLSRHKKMAPTSPYHLGQPLQLPLSLHKPQRLSLHWPPGPHGMLPFDA